MARNTVYVVREGLNGGYLPDSLSFFATKHDAQSYMLDRAAELRSEDCAVRGSARNGYYDYFPEDASDYHMGNSIVLGCVNADMYRANLSEQFESIDDLVQHLNDHYS